MSWFSPAIHTNLLVLFYSALLFYCKCKCPNNLCIISKIIPCCVLVALPERIQYPVEVRAPTAVAKARTTIPETKPQFGKRILEERRPLTYKHVNDDWFILLDGGTKESGIGLPVLWLHSAFFGRQRTHTCHPSFASWNAFAACSAASFLVWVCQQTAVHIHRYSTTSGFAAFRRLKK